MSSLNFKTVSIRNVLSIGDTEVTLDFAKYPLGLCDVDAINYDASNPEESKNGCGKTALLVNSILLALYEKTINNISNRYIFNRYSPVSAVGYIKLILEANKKTYMLLCSVTTNKRRDFCTLKHEVFLEKDNNWVDITKASKAETLKFIETEITTCDFEIFKNTIIISSSNNTNFFVMPKAIKEKYLQGVFNLTHFGLSYEIANKRLNAIKKQTKFVSEEYATLQNDLEQFQNKFNNWNNEKAAKIENLLAKKLELNKIFESSNIINKPDNFEAKQVAVNKLDIISSKKKQLKKDIDKVLEELTKTQAQEKYNTLLLQKNESLLNALCNDCKPKIKDLFKLTEAENELNSLKNKLNELNCQRKELAEKLNKAETQLTLISEANLELANYNNALKLQKIKLKNNQEQIIEIQKQITELQNGINPFDDTIKQLKGREQKIKAELDNAAENLLYYSLVKDIFSEQGVKQVIIADIVDALNIRIKTYLSKMGCDYTVYFDKNLFYEFITQTGPCEYASFSSGERKRLDLAVLFAFRDIISTNAIQTNIFVVDEVLDSAIDTSCLNSVISILNEKAKLDKQTIFIITHRSDIINKSDLFTSSILLTKKNGITTLS